MILGQQRRVGGIVRLGPPAVHDGRGLGEGRAGRVRAALPRRPRLSHRGAHQLVPGLPDERQRPRGDPDARDRHACGASATTCSTRRPAQPDPDATITVATTRPETILGDTAVAVHPDDARYAPLVGRRRADPVRRPRRAGHRRRGRGPRVRHRRGQDHARPRPRRLSRPARHGLAMPDDPRRRRARRRHRDAVRRPGPLRGPRSGSWRTSRPAATSWASRPHEMVIGRCQRSDDVVEPRLKTQWFVRTGPLAASALAATRSGETSDPARAVRQDLGALDDEHPGLERLAPAVVGPPDPGLVLPRRPRDGHRPIRTGPPACETLPRPAAELTQDPDIFDTWFSSGLWPFSTLGWPDATDDFRRYYPGTVMETGYDIIFFWVARMMMLGIHLTDAPPFRHGLPVGPHPRPVRPEDVEDEGQHASTRWRRSTSSAPTPCGSRSSTARRPATTSGSATPRSRTPATSRTSCGTRRASCSAPGRRASPRTPSAGSPTPRTSAPADRWVLSRAAATTEAVDRAMAEFNFGEVTRVLYDAIWSEYCDWGLELAKVRLADATLPDADREATWWALVEALDTYLRLLHPVMPFITERLWQALPHRAIGSRAADRRPLARRRGPGRGRRGRGRARSWSSSEPCATPARTRGSSPPPGCRSTSTSSPSWARRWSRCDPRSSGSRVRGRSGAGSPARRSTARRTAAGGLAVIAGPAEAIVGTGCRRPRRRGRRPRAAREGAGRRPAAPRVGACPARQRRVHVEGAAGGRRGRAGARGRARGPGGAARGTAGPVRRPGRAATMAMTHHRAAGRYACRSNS